jgi:hypothetical protein
MMQHVRPYKLFTLTNAVGMDRLVRIPIPKRRGIGGISLLETFLLVAIAKAVGAKRIFEIGTFLGTTTLSLALNAGDDAEILTLDMNEDQAASADQHSADIELTKKHLASRKALDFLETPISSKVKILTGDSTKFDFSPWTAAVDRSSLMADTTSQRSNRIRKMHFSWFEPTDHRAFCGTTIEIRNTAA